MTAEDTLLIEKELEDLRTRVRDIEERQRDDTALREFILKTIKEDIQTKGREVLSSLCK
jgi:hypothetical protein